MKRHVEEFKIRRYAIIIDEAHSSQTGDSAKELRHARRRPPPSETRFTTDDANGAGLARRIADVLQASGDSILTKVEHADRRRSTHEVDVIAEKLETSASKVLA